VQSELIDKLWQIPTVDNMKIGVVGCGALGSFYGSKLWQAGEDVWFLLRSDYEIVRREGLQIQSPGGDFHVRPACAQRPEEIGICDLVLIGLKTTANHQFEKLLSPLVGAKTAVLTLQNGLGNEDRLAELFAGEQILGGLCFVCLNRTQPGIIRHIGFGQVVIGEFSGPPRPRTREIASLFQRTGLAVEVTDNLEQAHWQKLVWNIPFNGLGVASGAGYDAVITGELPPGPCLGPPFTTDLLLGNPGWENLVRDLMLEVITAASRLGFEMPRDFADIQIDRTRQMGAYKASTLIDYEHGQPLELDSMFKLPLRRARETGLEFPRWSALCKVLDQLNARNLAARLRRLR